MTIFAGIIARRKSTLINDSDRQYLTNTVSRVKGEIVTKITEPNYHFVKVDIGAFGAPGICQDDNNVALLAGEPLLSDSNVSRTRDEDLRDIQQAIIRHKFDILTKSSGTFCAINYDLVNNELTLIADKFGVRPIYFWIGDDFVVFSTALRILEEMALVPKSLDIVGTTETACFAFPLADRTPYLDIKTIRESEIVIISEKSVEHNQYWRWDNLKPFVGDTAEAARIAHKNFIEAVQRRLRGDTTVAAFLSGGLDSRSIVATLRHLGVEVHTANMSDKGSQDFVFGAQVADALGCHHKQVEPIQESVGGRYSKREVVDWLKSEITKTLPPTRQNLMWGGDGGSVGMGYVYLNQKMVELVRTGNRNEAVEDFLNHNSIAVPIKFINPKLAGKLGSVLNQGIAAELDRLNCEDPGRNLHLFLMFNDQRRHLANIYENIDIDRVELQLPFFDAHFMETVLSLPLDSCMRHGFYMQWLDQFNPIVKKTPWQAYPGHIPCPIEPTEDLSYQWSQEKGHALKQAKAMASNYSTLEKSLQKFPYQIFNRKMLMLAYFLTYFGIRDFSYVLKFSSNVFKSWKFCNVIK